MIKEFIVIVSTKYEDEILGYFDTEEEALDSASEYRKYLGTRKESVLVARIFDK